LPNNCSERIEELALPKSEARLDDVTQLGDFSGLIHTDHAVALEARFPGQGLDFSKTFRERASNSAKAGWPPPARPETPQMSSKPAANSDDASSVSLRRGSVPVSGPKLGSTLSRTTDFDLLSYAKTQQGNESPPAPEQRKTMVLQQLINDPLYMGDKVSMDSYSEQSPSTETSPLKIKPRDGPPPLRPMVYPVLVPVVQGKKKANDDKVGSRLGGHMEEVASPPESGRTKTLRRTNTLRHEVKIARLGISIVSAQNLRAADRSGKSDPFCVCRVPGRPGSKCQTRVLNTTLNPIWKEYFEIDFFAGDELQVSVFDKDVLGNDLLGTATFEQATVMPGGIKGPIDLFDAKRPEEMPTLQITVDVLQNFDPDGSREAKAQRGVEDSDEDPGPNHEVCVKLDEFESTLRVVPRLGNFWMTPRGDMRTPKHDGRPSRAGPVLEEASP
jgi:hypothetical protein